MSAPPRVPSVSELTALRSQLDDLRTTFAAVRSGGVDAIMVGDPGNEQLFTLTNADRPYRVLVEEMGEGAATVSENGVLLYANRRLAALLGRDRSLLVGSQVRELVAKPDLTVLEGLLSGSAGEIRRGELRLAGAANDGVPTMMSVAGLDLDGVLVHCLVVFDLTDRLRQEKQLEAVAAAAAKDRAAQQRTEKDSADRSQYAREVNDSIVQGLVAAEMAYDLGELGHTRDVIGVTLRQARNWIGELLADQGPLQPGAARRRNPTIDHATTAEIAHQ